MSTAHVNLGVVGLKGWGKHVVRSFSRAQNCNLTSIGGLNRDLLSASHKLHSQSQACDQYETMLANPDTNPTCDWKREELKIFAA